MGAGDRVKGTKSSRPTCPRILANTASKLAVPWDIERKKQRGFDLLRQRALTEFSRLSLRYAGFEVQRLGREKPLRNPRRWVLVSNADDETLCPQTAGRFPEESVRHDLRLQRRFSRWVALCSHTPLRADRGQAHNCVRLSRSRAARAFNRPIPSMLMAGNILHPPVRTQNQCGFGGFTALPDLRQIRPDS